MAWLVWCVPSPPAVLIPLRPTRSLERVPGPSGLIQVQDHGEEPVRSGRPQRAIRRKGNIGHRLSAKATSGHLADRQAQE